MPRWKHRPVRLTQHAIMRAQDRGAWTLTARQVERRLRGTLRLGLPVEKGAIKVPLGEGLLAVCVPELSGGWTVVTVLREDEAV